MAAQQFARLSCLIAFTKFVLTRVRTGVAARWTAERLRRGAAVAAAIDVTQGSIVCGVRPDRYEAVTMVRVTGRPYTLTLLRGSSRIVSTNVVPLEVLAGLLDQPGALHLAGIDVLNAGYRVRPRATGYPPLYANAVGRWGRSGPARHVSDCAAGHHRVGCGFDVPGVDRGGGLRGQRAVCRGPAGAQLPGQRAERGFSLTRRSMSSARA